MKNEFSYSSLSHFSTANLSAPAGLIPVLFNTTRCNSCVPFHLATKFWRLNDLYIINNCSYLQREHFWKTLHSTDVLTATTVCARPFWWTFTRSDVKIKLKFPTNINFKTEPWSLMRRQDVVRRKDLNSKVKMIFEEKSDAIEIDVPNIMTTNVVVHSKL